MSANPQEENSETKLDRPDTAAPPAVLRASAVTDKVDTAKPPLTMEDKKKVWTRRIIGAIVFFAILGSLALLAAAQAVTFMFKMILTP